MYTPNTRAHTHTHVHKHKHTRNHTHRIEPAVCALQAAAQKKDACFFLSSHKHACIHPHMHTHRSEPAVRALQAAAQKKDPMQSMQKEITREQQVGCRLAYVIYYVGACVTYYSFLHCLIRVIMREQHYAVQQGVRLSNDSSSE